MNKKLLEKIKSVIKEVNGYDISYTDFTTTLYSPIIVTHHLTDHGNTVFGLSLKSTYVIDTRNRTLFAESGVLASLARFAFVGLGRADFFGAVVLVTI